MFLNPLLRSIALAQAVAAAGLREVIAEHTDLSIFKDLVDQYNVWQPFSSMENITVLAPNNAAYELLSQIGLNLSEMGSGFTVPILKYHFLEGVYDSDSFAIDEHATLVHTALTGLNMSRSAPVKLSRTGNDRSVEGGLQLPAGVVKTDISFDGGLLHVLNSTLVAPHNISATAFMNQLYEFLEVMDSSDMVGTMEDLHDGTIFIPKDTAWKKYKSLMGLMSSTQVAKILGYHAVKGDILYQQTIARKEAKYTTIEGGSITVKTDASGNILVNGVPVIKENLVWYGGVAHIIDDVLIPTTDKDILHYGSGIDLQNSWVPARSLVLYAKTRPVATAGTLSIAFVLVSFLMLAVFRQYWSKSAARRMQLTVQEQRLLPEKFLA